MRRDETENMKSHENSVNLVDGSNLDLHVILNHIRANKWLLLIFLTLSVAFAAYYIKQQVPVYETDILFQVDSKKNSNGVVGEISGGFASGFNSVNTQIALLKSRFILGQVVEDLHLNIDVIPAKLPFMKRIFQDHNKKSHHNVYVKNFIIPSSLINSIFTIVIESNRTVAIYDNNRLVLSGPPGKWLINDSEGIKIYIDSIDANPGDKFQLIKKYKSEVADSLLNQIRIMEINAGGTSFSATGILKMSMKGTNPKQLVDILNYALSVAKNRDIKNKSQEAYKTIEFLKKQLPITKRALFEAEQKLNKFRSQSGKLNLKFQTDYLLNQLMSLDKNLEELRVEKANLLKKYTFSHPVIIRIDSDMSTLEEQRIKLESILKTLPKSEQLNVNLVRDVHVKENLYVVLLNKIQELEVLKAGTVGSIRILSKATIPNMPIPVKKSAIYFASIILGLIGFMFFAFGRRLLFSKIDDPHWMERTIGVPTLAILPFCKEQSEVKISNPKNKVLIAYHNPKHLTIEALRSLRTSLQVNSSVSSNNIISILGISPNVGKSFVSNNFAYLLSNIGKKVVIVDCDLRAGTTHKYMQLSSANGISDFLSGNIEFKDVIKATTHENLFCITRGSFPKEPSELLMNSRFQEIIEKLSDLFDFVILDTPPILLVTDALIVSRFSSINYLVLGAGDHHHSEIENAIRRLVSADIKLNGSIFNFHSEQRKLHGDSYSYRYNSKYYYNSYGHYIKKTSDVN